MYLFQIGPLRFGKYAQLFALDQIFWIVNLLFLIFRKNSIIGMFLSVK